MRLNVLATLFVPSLAFAGPYVVDDPLFGADAATLDTDSGLLWLDLTKSTNLSYDQMVLRLNNGSIYASWRYASEQELRDFFREAYGIGSSARVAEKAVAALRLAETVGITGGTLGVPGDPGSRFSSSGILAEPGSLGRQTGGFGLRLNAQGDISHAWVSHSSGSVTDDYPSADTGHWLVRPFPYACVGNTTTGDSDGDMVCNDLDACVGDDTQPDDDSDGLCGDADPCVGASNLDADTDGVCDEHDLCVGDDAEGDADGDGTCDDLDQCAGGVGTGDEDLDDVCDPLDQCWGNDASGDADGDGVCDDIDQCEGDDGTGDADADGWCDDTDACEGDDDVGDADGDGWCDDTDLCMGDDTTGDTDADGTCDDTDLCYGFPALTGAADANGNGVCDLFLDAASLVPGTTLVLRQSGGPVGATVFFFGSTTGPGAGLCAPAGAPCLTMAQAFFLGAATVDDEGMALLSVAVPASLPPSTYVGFQGALYESATGAAEVSPVVVRRAFIP